MAQLGTFEQYFATSTPDINVMGLVIALILAALMSYILSAIYIHYGTALSNRRRFASNFLLLTTTTTLVISVVKSSLALSLGLVGALSIVRFRAAIKEPQELAFLFFAIAIGLGLGASQFLITVISFIIICVLVTFHYLGGTKKQDHNLSLTISGKPSSAVTLKKVSDLLAKHCLSVHLKRFDSDAQVFEASFFVTFDSFEALEKARDAMSSLSKSVKVIYLDRE